MNCLLFDSIKALVCLPVALLSRDDEFQRVSLVQDRVYDIKSSSDTQQ